MKYFMSERLKQVIDFERLEVAPNICGIVIPYNFMLL